MADLEDHAFQRDRGFLVRLVVFLILGIAAALFAASQLTGTGFAGCAARMMGAPDSESPPSESAR